MSFPVAGLSNPRFIAENRLEPYSDHRWYASTGEAKAGNSSFDLLLNGKWRFHLAENPNEVPKGFQEPGFDFAGWDTITVPSHVQLEGFDLPQYVNQQYPWDGRENVEAPNAPMKFNPTACYIKTFDAPALKPGERATLQFDGAEAAIALWVNGSYVGYAEDTFTPSTFDITDYLKPGENVLAAEVFKWTSASWLEDQDFFRFSGIFRDVWLRVRPAAHVEDLRVQTLLENLDLATVILDLKLSGERAADATVRAVLFDEDGNEVGPFKQADLEKPGDLDKLAGLTEHSAPAAPADSSEPVRALTLALDVGDPRLWSAERPYLYSALIEVLDADGEVVEVVPVKVGVRRFGIEDGLMRINGERVVFRGVNRHEFGENGRVVTKEETREDLILLKRLGVNAIRTAHYPNTRHLYDLADELGFYVLDEMNLETHGTWDSQRVREVDLEAVIPGDDPQWIPALEDRANNMLQTNKNHPSIVMWSIGNESYGGADLLHTANFLRARDDRPVHYEGITWDNRYPDTSDVYSHMYTPAEDVAAFIRANPDKPFILCEYAHAMGNSFGAVDKYTDLADTHPLYQGGFIWDFADQAIPMEDRYGNKFPSYGGDSGHAPHDGDFCGNGIFFLDRTPKPFADEVKYLYQAPKVEITPPTETEVGSFSVQNRWNFTNTDEYEVEATLSKEGTPIGQAIVETSVSPGETETFDLPFGPLTGPGEHTVDVRFRLKEDGPWAEAGFVVAREQEVFEVPDKAETETEAETEAKDKNKDKAWDKSADPSATLNIVEGEHNIGVHSETFSTVFSRIQGGLVSYEVKTESGVRPLLKSIPTPNFWHAPTSNETAWGAPAEDGQWLLASRYASFQETSNNPSLALDGDCAIITYDYTLPTFPTSNASVSYKVDPSGRIDVTLQVRPAADLPSPPEFGMLFQTDADLNVLRWYGDGPNESHADRKAGSFLGVHETSVADELSPYLKPQESGNHTGVRWAEVTDEDGVGLRFIASGQPNPRGERGMEFSALHWSPFEVENASHHHKLPPIHDTYLRPALMRRGVAGDNTWGARAHDEYLLPTGPLTFTFSFEGVS